MTKKKKLSYGEVVNAKNSSYWKKRGANEKRWITRNIKSDEEFNKQIELRYNKAIRQINADIESELLSLSNKNGIDINEVRGKVSTADIQSLEKLAKEVVQNAKNARSGLSKELVDKDSLKDINERMRLYNATMRINRLELLKSKIGMYLVDLGATLDVDIKQHLQDEYMAEYSRQAGIMANDTVAFNASVMKTAFKTIMATTGGVNFSKRVWAEMDAMKAELDNQLTKAMIQGTNPRDVARKLKQFVSDDFAKKRYATERIARTESTRVHVVAQKEQFKKYGVDYVRWHAEPSACKICRAIVTHDDGYGSGVYTIDDVPYLPAHPNCKCSLSAFRIPETKQIDLYID